MTRGHDTDIEFFAKVSHEIRQPLSAIQAATQLLKKCEDTACRERACLTIERQIAQMTHLLDDLIEATLLGSHVLSVRRARFDLRDVVEEAVEAVEPITAKYGQQLDVRMPDSPAWIEADASRLLQVVSNLLSNSLKHTRAGESIRVEILLDDPHVSIVVADTGAGIPHSALPHIFDPYVRAENASASGLGLGLAIVKQLVELQGGTVDAFSAGLGRGSRFVVSLPRSAFDTVHAIRSTARLLPY